MINVLPGLIGATVLAISNSQESSIAVGHTVMFNCVFWPIVTALIIVILFVARI